MPGRIPQAEIQDLLSRIDIIQIVQSRVPLTKKGNHYQACCPFHHEKTPSFTVSHSKQFYYCFGCKSHGNAINFLMHYDRMEFLDAVTYLADQVGIEILRADQSSSQLQSENFYVLLEKAAGFYQHNLRQSTQAIRYLKYRGVTGRTAKRFAIGYAPPTWDAILKRFDVDLLVSVGLVVRQSSGKNYDRFRDRVMFPIRNTRGKVIGFGGRSLGDHPPKYLNSPETTVFHKSHELYGLYEARLEKEPLTRLLIVEGYMDVVTLVQAGITYAVATLGTAVNVRHIQKALRYTNELVFCFDGDHAGQRAAWSALVVALPLLRDGVHLKFLFLPEGEDPDSLMHTVQREAFERLIVAARSLSDVFFGVLGARYDLHAMASKAQYADQALQYINKMPKGIFFQLMRRELSHRLGIDEQALETLDFDHSTCSDDFVSQHSMLNPAELASALLLQCPTLVTLLKDIRFLEAVEIAGKSLLMALIDRFRTDTTLTVGELLSSVGIEKKHQQQIAALAAVHFPLTEEALMVEFQGSLKQLQARGVQQQLDALIKKAKLTELNDEEKKKLSQLLLAKSPMVEKK